MDSIRWLSAFFLALVCIATTVDAKPQDPFPRPAELKPAIRFWTRIFTEVDSQHGLLHDDRYLSVVYDVISVPQGMHPKKKARRIKQAKQRYRQILLTLAKGKRKHLTADERRVLSLWRKGIGNKTLRAAANRLRFQLGMSDKFRAGLIRSWTWRPFIDKTLTEHGLPTELGALPHVESSFNPQAYSRVGAAGIWQFTRTTGRRYLRVDHVVDERMDPFKATEAAAKLLKYNYSVTGSWPLAITAYNHGLAGMRRAVRRLGSKDIARIIRRYKSRTFGFASRNFYAAFVAAVEVDNNATKYFGPLKRGPTKRYALVKLADHVPISALQGALGVDLETLKQHNRALMPLVWREQKYVPRGYEFRVPCTADCAQVKTALAGIPASKRHSAQLPDVYHKVRRGDTLSTIAARYRVSLKALAHLNGLRNRHRIRIGQKLRLPQPRTSPSTLVASVSAIPTDGVYTVKGGDSVSQIARQFGLTEAELLKLNRLANRNHIYVGQQLRVAALAPIGVEPSAEASPATAPEASAAIDAETPVIEQVALQAEPDAAAVAASAQAITPEDTEPLGPTLPSELHPDLSADPSDYSVASDGTIEAQAAETLGHYGEWLGVRTQRLRDINTLRFGESLAVGKRLKLDFSRVSPETFEARRTAYHRTVQAAFFERYQIADTHTHVVKRGESLWMLTHRKYSVPVWLLRQYNPDLELGRVRPGMKVIFPRVQRREQATQRGTSPARHKAVRPGANKSG